jgi:hypothetical protein
MMGGGSSVLFFLRRGHKRVCNQGLSGALEPLEALGVATSEALSSLREPLTMNWYM